MLYSIRKNFNFRRSGGVFDIQTVIIFAIRCTRVRMMRYTIYGDTLIHCKRLRRNIVSPSYEIKHFFELNDFSDFRCWFMSAFVYATSKKVISLKQRWNVWLNRGHFCWCSIEHCFLSSKFSTPCLAHNIYWFYYLDNSMYDDIQLTDSRRINMRNRIFINVATHITQRIPT